MDTLTDIQEMLFELVDIDEVQEEGYCNCYDISVTGTHDFILGNGFVSHNSAVSGLSAILGRDGFGYYELKGKPLNTYAKPFVSNAELSTLYKIIHSDNYDRYVFASDADLDGFHCHVLCQACQGQTQANRYA